MASWAVGISTSSQKSNIASAGLISTQSTLRFLADRFSTPLSHHPGGRLGCPNKLKEPWFICLVCCFGIFSELLQFWLENKSTFSTPHSHLVSLFSLWDTLYRVPRVYNVYTFDLLFVVWVWNRASPLTKCISVGLLHKVPPEWSTMLLSRSRKIQEMILHRTFLQFWSFVWYASQYLHRFWVQFLLQLNLWCIHKGLGMSSNE